MNTAEGQRFVIELLTAFPAFEDAARNSPDIAKTRSTWIRSWADLDFGECMDALDRLIKQGGISWDDYRAPGPFIRSLVLAGRSEADRASKQREATRYERQRHRESYTGSPMAAALAAATKCATKEEAYAVIEAALPSRPAYDQPRYKCSTCCDSGKVRVWRADFVGMVRDGKKPIEQLTSAHTYVIACYCETGLRLNEPLRKKLPVYSTAAFREFEDLGLQVDREQLQNWVVEQASGVAWVG